MTIKEVSEKFNLSKDTLRFYEKKGLIGPVKKTKSGIRNYEEQDLKRIEFIKCMRNAELPIDVLKKYIDLYKSGKETKEERKKLLENQQKILKAKIDKMQKAYKLLTDKIDLYNSGKIDEYLDISIKKIKIKKER